VRDEGPVFGLITCEHAGREVPPEYAGLFEGHEDVLRSHRGLDVGALGVAIQMASRGAHPLLLSTTTRLLVDLNRSIDHPGCFSELTRGLAEAERREIARRWYEPHRRRVEEMIEMAVASGSRVLHVGVHSCVDELDGRRRELEVGLLFDPARAFESGVASAWRAAIEAERPSWRVVFNEPYLGTDDGLTTTLRTRFPDASYAGVEVELRQGLVETPGAQEEAGAVLESALRSAGVTPASRAP